MKTENNVIILDPLIDTQWDILIQSHPRSTIFHSSYWARVINKTYHYKPVYTILKDNGTIKLAIPFFLIKNKIMGKRLVCLPFTDMCSPLSNSHENLIDQEIIQLFETLAKEFNINTFEIRGGEISDLKSITMQVHTYYKIFKLELTPGLEHIWKNLKQKSIRYAIKKALGYGLQIVRSVSEQDIKLFYRLNLFTRKKHGVIPQPYAFFVNIWQEIINKGLGFLLIAKYHERVIASSIFFIYRDTIYHKFNASDEHYLKYQPNHLILWAAIQWAVENGYKIMDLGRTAPDNIGLMAFKRHWGAKEFDLPYYYCPNIRGASSTKESNLKYKIASSVLKRTPIPILKIAGNLFYKHFG